THSEIPLETIDLRNEIPQDFLQPWAIAAEGNREQRGRLYEAVAQGVRQYGELASRNARNLLFYLKENTNINLEEELRGWRLKLVFYPYELIDLIKYPELEGVNISEEWQEDEDKVIGKAIGEAKVHEELELSIF
ncbi:MAG: hypothetical protein KDD09_27160, partial [Phaeodactylibacter sp.]|nr:hypothetical protein [Phaeodactylibacter sp.]